MADVSTAGLDQTDLTIDGTSLLLPARVEYVNPPRQTIQQAFSGRRRIDVPFDGDGLPDQPDLFDFVLAWNLDKQYSTEIGFLEALRTQGGIHDLCIWKKFIYRWTAKAGQQVFYLPRPDAYSKSYSGKTANSFKAIVKVNGTPTTLQYQTSVTSGTSVTAGEVWISNTATLHPDAGYTVALFKFGTAPGAGAIVTVEYHPLFRVGVTAVSTDPFLGDKPFIEDKVLNLTETN